MLNIVESFRIESPRQLAAMTAAEPREDENRRARDGFYKTRCPERSSRIGRIAPLWQEQLKAGIVECRICARTPTSTAQLLFLNSVRKFQIRSRLQSVSALAPVLSSRVDCASNVFSFQNIYWENRSC
jgi:hypothetical protein